MEFNYYYSMFLMFCQQIIIFIIFIIRYFIYVVEKLFSTILDFSLKNKKGKFEFGTKYFILFRLLPI